MALKDKPQLSFHGSYFKNTLSISHHLVFNFSLIHSLTHSDS